MHPARSTSGRSTGSTGPSRGSSSGRRRPRRRAGWPTSSPRRTARQGILGDRRSDATGHRSRPGPGEVWDDWLAARRRRRSGSDRRPRDAGRAAGDHPVRDAVRAARLPEGTSWLRLWPETGRTHQLRAQAAVAGARSWAIVAYGSSRDVSLRDRAACPIADGPAPDPSDSDRRGSRRCPPSGARRESSCRSRRLERMSVRRRAARLPLRRR